MKSLFNLPSANAPIADTSSPWQSPPMIKRITLVLCAIVAVVAAPASGRKQDDTKKLRWVRGLLNAHWEYPSFLPQNQADLKIMDFSIREKKWSKIYFDAMLRSRIKYPDKTICFRIIGQGFVAPREPTYMQSWEGSQFVFVKIKEMKRLPSDEQCASRMTVKGS